MSGLLRRLTRRRAATADETGPSAPDASDSAAAPPETAAEPGGGQATRVLAWTGSHEVAAPAGEPGPDARRGGEPPTGAPWPHGVAAVPLRPIPATGAPWPGGRPVEAPAPAAPKPAEPAKPAEPEPEAAATGPVPGRDLPAGVDPGELREAPDPSARRGRLRRRVRYLRAVRELLLRDLGGFTYELHRSASGSPRESHRRLADGKAGRIAALDAELRELESRLSLPRAETVLREPGVGGSCPECGELHASDARYCARCGTPLDDRARAERDALIAAAAPRE